MEYNIKTLAQMYEDYLTHNDFNISFKMSQSVNFTTYNEYQYIQLMKNFDRLYYHLDSLDITEKFLKGD